MPVLTVVRAVLFWIWLCVLASLLSTNALFGWPLPDDVAAVGGGLSSPR